MKTGTIEADGQIIVDAKSSAQGHGNFSTIYIKGTWGGGTITVGATPNGGEASPDVFSIEGGTLSADGYVNIAIKTTRVVLTLAGATDPDLTYWVV